jgi:hypothetical protein
MGPDAALREKPQRFTRVGALLDPEYLYFQKDPSR